MPSMYTSINNLTCASTTTKRGFYINCKTLFGTVLNRICIVVVKSKRPTTTVQKNCLRMSIHSKTGVLRGLS